MAGYSYLLGTSPIQPDRFHRQERLIIDSITTYGGDLTVMAGRGDHRLRLRDQYKWNSQPPQRREYQHHRRQRRLLPDPIISGRRVSDWPPFLPGIG